MKKLFFLLLLVSITLTGVMAEPAYEKGVAERVDGPFAAYATPVHLTLGRVDHPNPNWPDGHDFYDNLYYDWMAENLNIIVTTAWLAADNDAFNQKVALGLASGDIPDIMKIQDKILFYKLAEAEAIGDFKPYFDENVSDYLRDVYGSYGSKALSMGRALDAGTVGGKLYGIPQTNIGEQQNYLWVRTDWLDKVGLDIPTTLDEIVTVGLAFKNGDPDGNGKADTVGISGDLEVAGNYNRMHGWDPVFGMYGSYPRQWIRDADGEVTYGTIEPETKKALAALRSAFASGVIDPEFATRQNTNEVVANGKVGMIMGPWWAAHWPLNTTFDNDKDARWFPVLAPVDSMGKLHGYSQDPAAQFLVMKAGLKNPEAVIKVLNASQMFIQGHNPSADEYIKAYYDDEGKKFVEWRTVPIDLQVAYEDTIGRWYDSFAAWEGGNPLPGSPDYTVWVERKQRYLKGEGGSFTSGEMNGTLANIFGREIAHSPNMVWKDPVFFGVTKTMQERWASLVKIENEMLLQIIMGDKPLSYFDEFVETWLDLGGDDIISEVKAIVD
ncbi:MAG: hypothetical protein HN368_13975 [Spirochaetales bacterium]|jgi:putative aldouronate transport system substrate-binding protein|nr:hypothetical protein [Spirochaetales bacterium]